MATLVEQINAECAVAVPNSYDNITYDFSRGAYNAIVTVRDGLDNVVVQQRGVAIPVAADSNMQLNVALAVVRARLGIEVVRGSHMYMHPPSDDQRTYLIKGNNDLRRYMRLYPKEGCMKILLPDGAHVPTAEDQYEA